MVGGVLGFASLLTQIYFFRGANRFGIYLIALVFLFLAEWVSRRMIRVRASRQVLMAFVVLLFAFFDLPIRRTQANDEAAAKSWTTVKRFTSRIEKQVGHDAMIFVLPVLDFPEVPPRYHELHYAPLELYLAPSSLRFSYGDSKGHFRDTWQHTWDVLPGPGQVTKLEEYGFSGVVLFRNAYEDDGAAFRQAFADAGYPVVFSSHQVDFIQLRPAPLDQRILPPSASLELGEGWASANLDAKGKPVLVSHGSPNETPKAYFSATFDTTDSRELRLRANANTLFDLIFEPGVPYLMADLEVALPAPINDLTVSSARGAPSSADDIAFAFGVRNVSAEVADQKTAADHACLKADNLPLKNAPDLSGKRLVEVETGKGDLWREFRDLSGHSPLTGLASAPLSRIEFLPKGDRFSIACIVSASGQTQSESADLFSCHSPTFQGLCLERLLHAPDNRFQLLAGDGHKWIAIGESIVLPAEQACLLVLNVTESEVSVRLEGSGVHFEAHHPTGDAVRLAHRPWYFGDWVLGGHQFKGRLELVSLQEAPLDRDATTNLVRRLIPSSLPPAGSN